MTVELSAETERQMREAVQSGRFASTEELLEAAVHLLLEQATESKGKFHRLRQRIEESGIPLLSDEELRSEIRERRGPWA